MLKQIKFRILSLSQELCVILLNLPTIWAFHSGCSQQQNKNCSCRRVHADGLSGIVRSEQMNAAVLSVNMWSHAGGCALKCLLCCAVQVSHKRTACTMYIESHSIFAERHPVMKQIVRQLNNWLTKPLSVKGFSPRKFAKLAFALLWKAEEGGSIYQSLDKSIEMPAFNL